MIARQSSEEGTRLTDRQAAHDKSIGNAPPGSSISALPSKVSVTPRAFVLGLSLALLLCAVTPYNDQYIAATYIAGNFFPIGAFGAVLMIVLIINPLIIRIFGASKSFAAGEIFTIWSMITVASGLPSSGLMRYLIAHIAGPHYYASPVNGWESTILPHIPSYLLLNDPHAIRTFFEGLRPGEAIPWKPWLLPLSIWGVFVACFLCCFFCLSAILRRQWVDRERLTFPLVQVPLMLAEAPEDGKRLNALMRSPMLWGAVAAVTLIHTIKGLHLFFPTIPDIKLSMNTSDFLVDKPWNQLSTQISIFPLIIGFAFLVPSEVSFSLWFFFVLYKLQTMIGFVLAIDGSGPGQGICMGPAYIAYQEAGGTAALIMWLLWSMRSHLGDVIRKAIFKAPDVNDSAEPMPYRAALFGSVISILGMFIWLTAVAHVVPQIAATVVIGAVFIFVLVSWLVSQAGMLFCQVAFSPVQLFTAVDGTANIPPSTLAMAAFTEHVGWYDARELAMPSIMNANKGATETKLNARSLTAALASCIFCALIVSAAAFIALPYLHGGVAHMNTWTFVDSPQIPFKWTKSVVSAPHGPQALAVYNMIGGGVFVLALFACRSAFTWFAIHPAGFLVAGTYPISAIWFSIFLGWMFKGPVMRYGGIVAYRRLLPMVVGLIIGDCLNALVWVVFGLITHTGYELLPG